MNNKHIFIFMVIAFIGMIIGMFGSLEQNDIFYVIGIVLVVQSILGIIIIILRSE